MVNKLQTKKIRISLSTPVLILLSLAIPFYTQDISFGAKLSVEYANYIQGAGFTRGSIISPVLGLDIGNLSSVLKNICFFSARTQGEFLVAGSKNKGFQEMDISLSYNTFLWKFSLTPSVNLNIFPARTNYSDEALPITADFGFSVGFNILDYNMYSIGNFGIYTDHKLDFLTTPGGYIGEIGLYHNHWFANSYARLSSELILDWANRRYNQHYFNLDKTTISNLRAKVSLSYDLCTSCFIEPSLQFNYMLDKALHNQISDLSLFNAGLSFGLIY